MTGIDRAIDLCTQTLAYGKATSVVVRPIVFEFAPIAEEIGRSLGIGDRTDIRFTNQVGADFQLFADPDQIYRACLNLARNAVEAIEDDEEEGAIILSAWHDAGQDIIHVADTGPGMPPEARDKLFKPFQGSTRKGGTGLGLPNVLEIASAHGGEVTLVKSDSTGTIFAISLPHPADAM